MPKEQGMNTNSKGTIKTRLFQDEKGSHHRNYQ